MISKHLREAIEESIDDEGLQSDSLKKKLIAWLDETSQRRLDNQEHLVHLENVLGQIEVEID